MVVNHLITFFEANHLLSVFPLASPDLRTNPRGLVLEYNAFPLSAASSSVFLHHSRLRSGATSSRMDKSRLVVESFSGYQGESTVAITTAKKRPSRVSNCHLIQVLRAKRVLTPMTMVSWLICNSY